MPKAFRILSMYDRMVSGKGIVKRKEAERFHVDLRTIQRDLDDIRVYLAEEHGRRELVFDKRSLTYVIRQSNV